MGLIFHEIVLVRSATVVAVCDFICGTFDKLRSEGLPLVRCSIQAVGFQATDCRSGDVDRRRPIFPYNAQVAFFKGPILEEFLGRANGVGWRAADYRFLSSGWVRHE